MTGGAKCVLSSRIRAPASIWPSLIQKQWEPPGSDFLAFANASPASEASFGSRAPKAAAPRQYFSSRANLLCPTRQTDVDLMRVTHGAEPRGILAMRWETSRGPLVLKTWGCLLYT